MRLLETRDTLALCLTYHHCWSQTLPLHKKCTLCFSVRVSVTRSTMASRRSCCDDCWAARVCVWYAEGCASATRCSGASLLFAECDLLPPPMTSGIPTSYTIAGLVSETPVSHALVWPLVVCTHFWICRPVS